MASEPPREDAGREGSTLESRSSAVERRRVQKRTLFVEAAGGRVVDGCEMQYGTARDDEDVWPSADTREERC